MSRPDPTLTPAPKVKLSRLRDIGWSKWDPIGLLGADQKWEDKDRIPFADEYDRYLLQAASQLRRGISDQIVVSYLVDIEANYMRLGASRGALNRAQAVVEAIQADEELWTYPD
ncbi:hypothetical protein [uncultured Tateyamaria sp.]|uniref:hypothetical protein n=1 Tax=uncultured Tateyamaria sp. TaxID=455651 RepID=UPI002602EA46|nr:hypothetical protein [uncultured Tateyamaria sp.]